MQKWKLITTAALLAAGSAQARMVASESFDYGNQDNTTKFLRGDNNHNGGTGWNDEWKNGDGRDPDTRGGLRLDLSGSASQPYPAGSDLSSAGGRIADQASGTSRRAFSAALDNVNANYFSVLINWGGTDSTISMQLGDVTTDLRGRWTPLSVDGTGLLKIGGASANSADSVQLTAGTDYMVVGKRTSVGTDRTFVGSVFDISNAGTFYNEPVSWDMTATAGSGVQLTHLQVSTETGTGSSMIDEIRFGTTYADVAGTIPEPATPGLVGAFGGGILFIRRRFMM